MTKEEIIKIIVVAFISVIAKGFFDKIIAPYIPDTKKLISYAKKLLLFSLRYALPMYVLINSFINDEIGKLFIFKVVFMSIALFVNLVFDIMFYFLNRLVDTIKGVADVTDRMSNTQGRIVGLIEKIIDNRTAKTPEPKILKKDNDSKKSLVREP